MKSFKNRYGLIAGTVALLLFATACQETGDTPSNAALTEDDQEFALTLTESEGMLEEIEEIAFGVEEELTGSRPDERIAGPPVHLWRCADVIRDTLARTIIVDFGDGCEGADGKVRSGKILISYEGRLHLPGGKRTISLEDYMVDSIAIAGTRVVSNVSDSPDDFVSLKYELIGGQITWPDGKVSTRETERTRTWIRGATPMQDEFQIEGFIQGTNREGESYSMQIVETLIHKRACRRQGVFIAVDGVKVVSRPGKSDMTIDFGDGECDHLITITVEGQSREINVREEMIKRLRQMRRK